MRAKTSLTLLLLILASPLVSFAETGPLSSEATLKQLILIVSQDEARIKYLESENALLRNEMVKAGIKIPLSDYSGVVALNTGVISIPSVYLTGILTTPPLLVSTTGALLAQLTSQYGKDVGGFILRIEREWKDIRNAYKLPTNAQIGGYEFVQSGSTDHVFVDIVYGTWTAGIYDAKILYQFEKSEYKRKLVGFFEYNKITSGYTTRSGANPFAGVARSFVRDPYFGGQGGLPATATHSSSNGSNTPVISGEPTPVISTPLSTVAFADIEKAYSEKRYLSVISLSNNYLTSNTPSYDLLRIRYRTYFIIGKYSESLAEISKIQTLWKLDKQTACDAQVIATYSKDISLVSKYAAVCSGK